MRIAVDAMGGDFAPCEIVKGAVQAAQEQSDVSKIILVGNTDLVQAELDKCHSVSDKIEICHATEVVDMDEAPANAVRRKKDSSISRAIDLVKAGDVDAVVSAGNTGAVVVAATLKLRTLEGIDRPAIAVTMPTEKDPYVLVDGGANTDCDARMLNQFAVMGHVYSRIIMHRESPVVGLLSIGGEDSKGNETTKEVFGLLGKSNLNFKGNIEGGDLFKGETDVVVCDGFVGNIVLKTTESTAKAIGRWMKQEFVKNPVRMLGAMMLKGAIKAMKAKTNPELYGGALLLGVNGVCIITHGSSSARAIFHAIRVAAESVGHHLNQEIIEGVKDLERE